jgi:hypothetical protein
MINVEKSWRIIIIPDASNTHDGWWKGEDNYTKRIRERHRGRKRCAKPTDCQKLQMYLKMKETDWHLRSKFTSFFPPSSLLAVLHGLTPIRSQKTRQSIAECVRFSFPGHGGLVERKEGWIWWSKGKLLKTQPGAIEVTPCFGLKTQGLPKTKGNLQIKIKVAVLYDYRRQTLS